MSQKYTGGFITKSPVAPTTTAASGIWTLDQQQQAQKAGTWPSPPIFIEDLFSTYLYTGNSSTQTITNGIDLSGKGGLVWIKNRQTSIGVPIGHILTDTQRGVTKFLRSQSTSAQETSASSITAFNSTGFSFGSDTNINYSGDTYASWTFAKQPKFFDVVTYTGDGVTGRTVAHNLGAVPGFIIVKPFSTGGAWAVAARKSDGDYAYGASTYAFGLNSNEQATSRSVSGLATDTTFTPAAVADVGTCNNNGVTYVAYLFAHNAGGFPVSGGGSTNGISCGSFTVSGGNASVTLGYEPQWVLVKNITDAGNWLLFDIMRGMPVGGGDAYLQPNTTNAESSGTDFINPTATGFNITNLGGSQTFIYIAIRRGPMKTPTVGTSVFQPYNAADTTTQTVGFPTDMYFDFNKTGAPYNVLVGNRLVGTTAQLFTQSTAAESNTYGPSGSFASNTTFAPSMIGAGTAWYSFRRTPSFFDVVCYTGTGVATTQAHNLAAVPEFLIVKRRNATNNWAVYSSALGNTNRVFLNQTQASAADSTLWNNTTPTSSVFTVGTAFATNNSGDTYIAYLFATCAGVSKVGSYTGNGTTQTIDCGFTGGARFVLIKRTDSTGDWYVYDTARGMTVLTDPYLLLNTADAQVATLGSVTTVSTGFALDAAVLAAINTNAASYIFLAIA